jgi:hypothetical protein
MRHLICLALLALSPATALAQDYESGEIVVTGTRREADDYDESIPAVGLKRTADFAIQMVTVVGDTRDQQKRRDEIFAMIRGAIDLAGRRGDVELATGEMVVEPLTAANYRNLALSTDGRPDTDRTSFLVKTRLSGSDAKTALDRIAAFIKAVPTVGRAEMRASGDLTLSIVGPDRYRGQIVDLVAADAKATAAKLGADYAGEATGLDRPVEWSRASLTEVFLYVPYRYTVVPARR